MKGSKKRVLFVSHCSYLGGAEIVLLRFLENVTEFIPILFVSDGPLHNEAKKRGIRIFQSKFLQKLNKVENVLWPLRFLFQFFGSQFEIVSLIKKLKPDVVQSNSFYAMVYCVVPCLMVKLPLIWHMHDMARKKRTFRWLSWLFQFFSARIVAVSEAVKGDLIESGVNSHKVKTVYNSLSSEQASVIDVKLADILQRLKEDRRLIIGSLGTIEERKGIREVIECVDILVNGEKRNVHYVVAGEAKDISQKRYWKELNREIERKNLQRNVSFIGNIEAIKTFFENIDIFVHFTKYSDPLATVILEALLFQCQVVVSGNGGNPECVQFGRWGKIVPEGDIVRLAKEIPKRDYPRFTPAEYERFLNFFSHAGKEREHTVLYNEVSPQRSP